jgi:hypothetical protein
MPTVRAAAERSASVPVKQTVPGRCEEAARRVRAPTHPPAARGEVDAALNPRRAVVVGSLGLAARSTGSCRWGGGPFKARQPGRRLGRPAGHPPLFYIFFPEGKSLDSLHPNPIKVQSAR